MKEILIMIKQFRRIRIHRTGKNKSTTHYMCYSRFPKDAQRTVGIGICNHFKG